MRAVLLRAAAVWGARCVLGLYVVCGVCWVCMWCVVCVGV